MLLSSDEIKNKLEKLNGWSYENNSIYKLFLLNEFSSAIAFAVRVGIESEKIDHHPDIFIHSWNKCKITISTHSEGGVTEKDFLLAGFIEKIK